MIAEKVSPFPRLFFCQGPKRNEKKSSAIYSVMIQLRRRRCRDSFFFSHSFSGLQKDFFVDVSGHDWIQKSSDLLCSSSAALQDFLTRKRTSFLAPLVYVVFPQQPPAFDKVVGNFPEEQRRSHPFFPLLWRFSKWPQLQKFQYFLTLCCCHSIFSIRAIFFPEQSSSELLPAGQQDPGQQKQFPNFIPLLLFQKATASSSSYQSYKGDLSNRLDFMFSWLQLESMSTSLQRHFDSSKGI